MTRLDTEKVTRYLERIGLDPADVRGADRDIETLARLQAAHVRTVPFETLSIVGDPFEDGLGEGVTLTVDHLYEKIVQRRRGGYCFELNGLFTELLRALGFDAHRASAIVLNQEGEAETPANHHTVIVSLDRPVVADPGLGIPQMTTPVPLDGEATNEDAAGVAWRVQDSERPDSDHVIEVQKPDSDWTRRYVFDRTPRELSYFEATNAYFSKAPESMWTNLVIVRRKTEDGFRELRRDSLIRVDETGRSEVELTEDDWYDVLEREFGMSLP